MRRSLLPPCWQQAFDKTRGLTQPADGHSLKNTAMTMLTTIPTSPPSPGPGEPPSGSPAAAASPTASWPRSSPATNATPPASPCTASTTASSRISRWRARRSTAGWKNWRRRRRGCSSRGGIEGAVGGDACVLKAALGSDASCGAPVRRPASALLARLAAGFSPRSEDAEKVSLEQLRYTRYDIQLKNGYRRGPRCRF